MTIVVTPVFHEDNKYMYCVSLMSVCITLLLRMQINLLSNMQTLEYGRTDVSEGIYINKIDDSRECIVCHYWYFFEIDFRFQLKVCDGCHDLMMLQLFLLMEVIIEFIFGIRVRTTNIYDEF